jgi:regulator of RNase E activity RraA
LGLAVARSGLLRPLWPDCGAVAGELNTVRLEPAGSAPSPLPELLDLLATSEGRILLVDLSGRVDVQCWGTVLATAARRFGVRGVLVNGAARDIDGLRELGLPTYARGVHPGAMRGRLRLVAVGEPVALTETEVVAPGSFAVADASGIVALPADRADEVVVLARSRREREQTQLCAIEAGRDPRHVLADDGSTAGDS